MGSPKRHNNLTFTPLTYHVDWDSPSTKTGTVKRRPNSCGDALKLINFDDEPEFEGSRQCLNDRKISLDLTIQNNDEQINHLNNSVEVEEKIDKILNDVVNKTRKEIPSFCKQISVEEHKFLVDKTGKIMPETATLFPVIESDKPKKCVESKLKPPQIISDLVKNEPDAKMSTKSVISKLKLNFSPSKTNPDKSRFKMFSTKPSYKPKQSALMSLNKEVVNNEYVNPAAARNNSIKRVPSKIPITPVDNENKVIHLSPNKKYTVTSKYGVRCDKDHYAVYDPESGFGDRKQKKFKKENVSDTDSGILSPMSPMDTNLEMEKNILINFCDKKDDIIDIVTDFNMTNLQTRIDEQEKIYTDWANHYLERGRSGRRVRQLAECGDGKLLRDLLEAVTGQRVPDCRGHQHDDITACLQFLSAQRVQGLEQVTAAELRQGRLRAILALFFALSRHKQATKQHRNATCDSNTNLARTMGATACDDFVSNNGVGANRQVSKAVAAAAGTAIPLPRRTRPLPPTPGSKGGSTVSGSSSRSSSPIQQTPTVTSPRIPTQHQAQINNHGSRPNSSLLTPGSKIPSSPYCGQPASPGAPTPPPHQAQNASTKHSMLDKLKLFKDKSSSERQKNNPTISKRTSSSSGFSSAKSERSDSSLSLNESHTISNSHIKGPNCITKQVVQTDISKDKPNKTLKSKLAPSKQQKDSSSLTKPQKNEKSSKNSPKLQPKDKESKIAPPKTTLNAKPLVPDDSSKQTKISVKQDTKISRLSGSHQMKLGTDQRIPTEGIANKLSPTDPKIIQTSIQPPKINSACNGITNSNSASFAANNVPTQCQNSTGIPKPTAAVKGTSKIPKDEKASMSLVKSNSNISQMSPSQSNSTLMTNSTGSTTLPFNRELSSLTKENCQKQTLIVSPMPNSNSDNQSAPATALNPALSSQMSESSNSNSTHSASTGPHSNSSDGSVIYRPSSESGSEMSKLRHNPIIPNRKIDVTAQFITDIISENQILEKQSDAKKNIMNNTVDPKVRELNDRRIENVRNCNSPMHSKENSLGDEDNPSMNVLPMRPLLRGYNSHLTLPARSPSISAKNGMPQNFPHHANTVKANFGRENLNAGYGMRDRNNGQYMPMGYAGSEYCDLDIAAGYMSEGDCMRRLGPSDAERERSRARVGDILDGYMSEGGASLYARKNYQNGPVASQHQFDDRAKANGAPNCINRGPDFLGGNPANRQAMEQQHQGTPIYRLTPSRNKKTDSSQQTDTSNYKVINTNGHSSKNGDSQWKKYTDSPGVGSPVQSGTPTSPISARRRGTSGTQVAGQRPKQTERLTAAQQLGATAPPPHQMHFGSLSGGQHSSKSGAQLQSPGSVSSQSSNRSSVGNTNSHMVPGPNMANQPVSGNGGRVKGVPQSFGYVKRPGGQTNATNGQPTHQNMNLGQLQGGRTAQVSAVPRTKVKVSGGTQTCTQDLQIHKGGAGVKSFSLSGSAASQLSQSVRERLMLGSQSLPKPGSHDFAVLFQHHRVPPRGGMKISDGSLSDTQTYSDVKSDYGSPYTSWLRHSNTYSASGRLSECDSMESLQSLQPTGSARVPAPPRLLHQTPPSRLNRSNSIRSTKSEKLYPSMLQRSSEGDYEPYYCLPVNYGEGGGLAYGTSEPPSPSPRSALSPPPHGHPHSNAVPQHPLLLPSSHHSVRHSHHYKKNDDAHGSTASLVSTASSLHSSAEERQAHEARKLRRELTDAKEKVYTLTTQLSTNAHVVSAFEQSLSNMTQRLQQLTATAERKDSELTQLRQTIELLRKQSIQAGLTSAHMTSMGIKQDSVTDTPKQNSIKQTNTTTPTTNGSTNMTRHHSTDSVSSLNSLSSGCSSAQDKKQKKKGWLRSSFTKAFSRNAKISKTAKHSSLSHLSSSSQEHSSIGGDHHTIREGSNENSLENSHEILADLAAKGEKIEDLSKTNSNSDAADGDKCDPELVDELKKQLREKDLVLTDIRLEALSSAHQLESLKDTVIKMRNEMLNLKQNNERLQRLVRPRSLAGSHASLSGATPPGPAPSGNTPLGSGSNDEGRRFSAADAQRSNNDGHGLDLHNQQLELDFKYITSTPTMEYGSKMQSPIDRAATDIYRASQDLSLSALEDADLMNGSPGNDDDPLLTGGRLSGVDCDISSVLPPPKCRELAMGETYPDLGLTENSVDVVDGKKIAIAVYLGQPESFSHYFEEICESLNNSENHYYSNRSSVAFSSHPHDLSEAPSSPRINHMLNNSSPDRETNEFQTTKSNTNSLKSNKSAHSNAFKNNYNGVDPTVNCNEFVIAYTYISGKTTWQNLDYTVRKTFKDYLSRIDPGTNLGLNTDSITSYHLGEATRGPEIGFPELLPCGYIIGTVRTLYICLQGVGSLAFDSLIPKNIVYRYVSLLSEHRRVILCGPSGTGKSYLAARLAEFHVSRTAAHINPAEAIATFNVEHKSSKELRQYLSNMVEQCGGDAALPSVLILDNLHHASALTDVFSGLLGARRTNLPCIIGTMSQATCNTTNLQLHHNFRWLLTANHMEPVKGFLARYLRRKQLMGELSGVPRCPRIGTILEWLPAVWQHVNSFLEAHSSSDVTVGPRLFLGCPLDMNASQVWFTTVWNQSVVPYLIEAAREGVALYGRRGAWSDPVKHVRDTYPWPDQQPAETLRGITLEDIGLDGNTSDTTTSNNQDPLLNMLMRLREAANYNGNHSQDSDNASLDSNMTHDSSVGNEL